MKPLRKEQIDLVDVLLEGGVAGRVVLNVIRRAQTFTGVEGDLRWSAVGFAARRAGALATKQGLGQGLVVVLGGGQQQLGKNI